MITKLLIHPSIESRTQAVEDNLETLNLSKTHPDVFWLEDEKLGVEQAKQIRQFLSLKPYSAKGRVVIVLNAQNFTNDAQNSLLKTLEEPPTEATILLAADSDKKILQTVLSRCETVILNDLSERSLTNVSKNSNELRDSLLDTANGSQQNDIDGLLKSSIEERFEFIEKLEDKEAFFHGLLAFFHAKFKKEPKYLEFTKDLLKAEAWKEANGNIRAILEYLMLKL